jgi:hypothetical protein
MEVRMHIRSTNALQKSFPTIFISLILISISIITASGQTIFGRISGTVTDPSGAVVPNTPVTVTSEKTNISRTVTTDENGFYVVTNLPVGDYTVSVEQQGFKKALSSGNNVAADARVTVDVQLETGQVTETVEVTSSLGEAVNTTSGEVARVVDREQVQNLALNARNFIQLASLIPGAALLSNDALGMTTSLNFNAAQSINGGRTNTNNIAVDGTNNLDSGSNNSIVNNVGIDFIEEVKIQSANFSAEYGRNSGASINVVTRSGGNDFHGSIFEYVRNDRLDAREPFAPVRNRLRFNDFGYYLSGPIKKDKMFFFVGQEWKFIRRYDLRTSTVPTRDELRGDFRARMGSRTLTGPSSWFIAPNVLNPAAITPNGRAIQNVFQQMLPLATSYTDDLRGSNATFQQTNPFDFRQDLVRIDYRFNEKHSIYGRYVHDMYDLIDPYGTFIGSGLPTVPTNRKRPGTGIQVSYQWLPTPTIVNEFKVGTSYNGQRVPPVGDYWRRDTYGFNFREVFPGGLYTGGLPRIDIRNYVRFDGPDMSLLSPTTDITIGDNLTITRGSHTIKTGFSVIRNRKDQNGRQFYNGNFSFDTSGNPNTTGNSFADALLGNFRRYEEYNGDPVGFFRFTQWETYLTDNWKVRKNLSFELGVRYQYGTPIYTQANNISNFVPRLYNEQPANTSFRGMIRAGEGVPLDEYDRIQGDLATILAVPAGAPRGLYEAEHLFAPRISFAYSPFDDNKTSIRGGFGMFYDRPEGNIIFPHVNNPPFLLSVSQNNGNMENIRAAALTTFGTVNAIDENLTTPYTMNYSLSLQRELPWGLFGEVAYVGNQGRHLLRRPDINQIPYARIAAGAQLVDANRPYRGYSAIRMLMSDAILNYNSLQTYLAKRSGNLMFTVSYTLSKALADATGNGDNFEDWQNKHLRYGPTDTDRRHIFVSTYTYALPFFRDAKGWQRALLSGYELSGITRLQSGAYLTPTFDDTFLGSRRADYIGGDLMVTDPTVDRWFNTAAFRRPPNTRAGTAGVGIIEGPGLQLWDISARKRFYITERHNVELRADFFNVFNQTNLTTINTNVTNSNFGRATAAAVPRNIQLAIKYSF